MRFQPPHYFPQASTPTTNSLLMFRRLCSSLSHHQNSLFLSPNLQSLTPKANKFQFLPLKTKKIESLPQFIALFHKMGDTHVPKSPIPSLDKATRPELLRAIESTLGSSFSSDPIVPPPNPLIIVISGPSGVGKDAVIKRLREVRESLHFVVTATSRPMRPGEIDGKDYFFVSKDEFLSMVDRDELLEYALVYGDYKGIPKREIRDYMARGCDIVLRVDVQGANTLRNILGNSAVFIFLVADSELELVERLIDRKTESAESLVVRIATAREEVKHVRHFDYVVVNAEGKLDSAVKLVESIIDAEKAKVRQKVAVV